MGVGTGDGDLARFQGLAEAVEHLRMEFGQFVQKEHAAMGQGGLAGTGPAAAADHGGHGGGMMGGAVGPAARQTPLFQKAGDGMDHRDIEQFLRPEGRQKARQAFSEHGLAGAGRADHQQVMPARRRDFERPLGRFLTLHIAQIRPGAAIDQLAGRRAPEHLDALEVIDELDQGARGENGEIAARPGRFRPARFRADQAETGFIGRHRSRQHARRGRDGSVQAELAEREMFGGAVRRDDIHRGEQADGDRQVEMRALLGPVGRGEIDDQPLLGKRQAEGGEGAADPLPAFRDRLVRQPDDGEGRQAGIPGRTGELDLDRHAARLRPVEGDRGGSGGHGLRPPALRPVIARSRDAAAKPPISKASISKPPIPAKVAFMSASGSATGLLSGV